MLKDDTRPDSRWFLVNWDMDHAFQDLYQSARRGSPWEHDTFRTLFRDHDTRTEVIRRLVREDPDYREYFKRALVDAVNHQLTPEFLQERYDYYARTGDAFRVPHTDYLPILQSFLRMRTAALMRRAPEYVGSPGSYRYELTAPEGAELTIDGHDVGNHYEGWYFHDMNVQVDVAGRRGREFAYWVVNGERLMNTGSRLEMQVTADTTVEAVFRSTT